MSDSPELSNRVNTILSDFALPIKEEAKLEPLSKQLHEAL